MSRRLFILCVVFCLLCGAGGLWLGATVVIASPSTSNVPDDTPTPIANGSDDVARFFHAVSYGGNFKLMSALRDESLGRRYYRVRVGADHLVELRQHLVGGWTWGHFNRAVYENNVSSRLPRSHNLPKWWTQTASTAGITTIMLDHGGKPNWYVMLNPNDGEVNMMWVSR